MHLAYAGASGSLSAAKHAEGHAMLTLRTVSSCLMLCLLASSAWAAQPAMEQTEGASKSAFVLHEGGNMHTDQAALRERRARAYEAELREAEDELMAAKYAITRKYLAKLPAHEREAMQAELATQHATFAYRYPEAHARLLQRNPHKAELTPE
jgi:hypothetical protein